MTTSPFASVPVLTDSAALALVVAAVSEASTMGKRVSITVVDNSSRVIAVIRMDGAPLQSLQVSHDKAYTAAGYGIATEAWIDRASQFGESGPMLVTTTIDRMVPLAGGVAILSGDAIAGAVGVSGATASEDKRIAEIAIATVLGSTEGSLKRSITE